jgi:hypothetical protein
MIAFQIPPGLIGMIDQPQQEAAPGSPARWACTGGHGTEP